MRERKQTVMNRFIKSILRYAYQLRNTKYQGKNAKVHDAVDLVLVKLATCD